jgi:hypothetical protein
VCGYPGTKLRFFFLPFYALFVAQRPNFFYGLGLSPSRRVLINFKLFPTADAQGWVYQELVMEFTQTADFGVQPFSSALDELLRWRQVFSAGSEQQCVGLFASHRLADSPCRVANAYERTLCASGEQPHEWDYAKRFKKIKLF